MRSLLIYARRQNNEKHGSIIGLPENSDTENHSVLIQDPINLHSLISSYIVNNKRLKQAGI